MVNITDLIKSSGLNITKNRRRILEIFHQTNRVLSLQEIESSLPDIDRISLYRALKVFVAKGLIRKVPNVTKHPKYTICHSPNPPNNYAHFHCTSCEKTICLSQVSIPSISNIPKGYQVKKTNLVISGVCEVCI